MDLDRKQDIVSVNFVVKDINEEDDINNIIKGIMETASSHLHHFIAGCGYNKNTNSFFINIENHSEQILAYITHTKVLIKEVLCGHKKYHDYEITGIKGY